MKAEQQVCTLEQAKRLKALGLTQQSMFCFIGDENQDPKYHIPTRLFYSENAHSELGKSWWDNRISAWNVGELGEFMDEHTGSYYSGHHGCWYWQILSFDVDIEEYPAGFKVLYGSGANSDDFETEAEARADQLIFMLENKLIEVDYLNEIVLDGDVTESKIRQPTSASTDKKTLINRTGFNNRHLVPLPNEKCSIQIIYKDAGIEHVGLCEWIPAFLADNPINNREYKNTKVLFQQKPAAGYLGTAKLFARSNLGNGIGFHAWEQNDSEFIYWKYEQS